MDLDLLSPVPVVLYTDRLLFCKFSLIALHVLMHATKENWCTTQSEGVRGSPDILGL
jgi:hypothetical protein